MIGEFLTA